MNTKRPVAPSPLRVSEATSKKHGEELENILRRAHRELVPIGPLREQFTSEMFALGEAMSERQRQIGLAAMRVSGLMKSHLKPDEQAISVLVALHDECQMAREWLDGPIGQWWLETQEQYLNAGVVLANENTERTAQEEAMEIGGFLPVLLDSLDTVERASAGIARVLAQRRDLSQVAGWYGPRGAGPEAHFAYLLHTQVGWSYPKIVEFLGKVPDAPTSGEHRGEWKARRAEEADKLERKVRKAQLALTRALNDSR